MKEVSCSKNRNFRNTSLQTNEFSKFSRALKSTAAHRRTVKSSEEQWRALGALHSVPPAWTPHRQTNWLAHRQGTARCLQSVRTAVAVQVVLPYKSIRVWSSVIRKIHGDFGPCQTRFASELGVHDIPWYSMIFHDIPWYSMKSCDLLLSLMFLWPLCFPIFLGINRVGPRPGNVPHCSPCSAWLDIPRAKSGLKSSHFIIFIQETSPCATISITIYTIWLFNSSPWKITIFNG